VEKNVDVAIHVYGKPYQTLVALKTLMHYSGRHIDKIFFIQEKEQPYGADFSFVLDKFENIIHFTPRYFYFISKTDRGRYNDKEYRYSLRW
jgi:hypothetical protein